MCLAVRVIVKNQGDWPGKLNKHITIGTFLRFGGNKRNVIFHDNSTHQTQSACHLEFDETHCHCTDGPPHAQKLNDIASAQADAKYHNQTQPKLTTPCKL